MKTLCVVIFLFLASFARAEDILLSLLTTDKELVVLRIEFSGNKYRIVDRAVFPLTSAGGLTAIAPLQNSSTKQNGNFQVAWNQADSSNKIKVFGMTLTPELDQIGNTKKNSPTLTSYFNLNILPTLDQFSIDFKNSVFVRARTSNGSMGGGAKKVFNNPSGFDPFNTNFVELGGRVAQASSSGKGPIYSCAVVYNEETLLYGIVFNDELKPGNEVVYTFGSDVVDAYCEGDIKIRDLWFIYYERTASTSRSGKAVTTLAMKRRKIDGGTLAPTGSIATLVPPKAGDRLGTIPFFNMFTVADSTSAASANGVSSVLASGAHVFYLEQANSCNSTVLKGFHFNTQTGKRNSPFSTLISCSDSLIGDTFLYGLAAFAL